jgi:iron(III) transport system substrate-binding protein
VRLIEFLAGEDAQRLFAEGNQEYPARAGVSWSDELLAWGEFRADSLNLARLGELNDAAVRIFDRTGWR